MIFRNTIRSHYITSRVRIRSTRLKKIRTLTVLSEVNYIVGNIAVTPGRRSQCDIKKSRTPTCAQLKRKQRLINTLDICCLIFYNLVVFLKANTFRESHPLRFNKKTDFNTISRRSGKINNAVQWQNSAWCDRVHGAFPVNV